VVVLPDIYANAGGVTVSYMGRVQNIQRYRWGEDRLTTSLRETMDQAYVDLEAMAKKHSCDFRTATFALAISRVVASATELRGAG